MRLRGSVDKPGFGKTVDNVFLTAASAPGESLRCLSARGSTSLPPETLYFRSPIFNFAFVMPGIGCLSRD